MLTGTGLLSWHTWAMTMGLVSGQADADFQPADEVVVPLDEAGPMHALVDEVRRRVGAPWPDEFRVTAHAECYAVELRTLSTSTQSRLVVVVGLPHLEVLTESEFKVILAHELAHFAEGDTRSRVFIFRFLELLHTKLIGFDRVRRWIDPTYWFVSAYYHVYLFLAAPLMRYQELRADCLSAAAYGGELASRTLLKEWLLAGEFERHLLARVQPGSTRVPGKTSGRGGDQLLLGLSSGGPRTPRSDDTSERHRWGLVQAPVVTE